MRRQQQFPVCALLALLSAPWLSAAWAAPAPQVELLGDPDKLRLVGCEAVPEKVVRRAIRADWRLQLASTPSAPLEEYLALLQSRLLKAYHSNGFPLAKVTAVLAADRKAIHVSIDEGRKLTAGRVLITGKVDGIDTTALIAALTTRRQQELTPAVQKDGTIVVPTNPPESSGSVSDPLWEEGRLPRSGPDADRGLTVAARRQLGMQGFCWPQFGVDRSYDGDRVDLMIRIDDPGRRATIETWKITGAVRNKPDEITALLGLKKGMPASFKQLLDLRARLWDCGRFLRHELRLELSESPDGPATLHIDLAEAKKHPLLNEPLSPIDQICLRFRDWVLAQQLKEADLVVKMKSQEMGIELAMNGSRGAVARFRIHLDAPAALDLEGAVLIAPQQLALYVPTLGRKLRLPVDDMKVCIVTSMLGNTDDEERELTLSFGASFEQLKKGESPGIELRNTVAPVAAIGMARSGSAKASLKDGVLTIERTGQRWMIDEKSGVLIGGGGTNENEASSIELKPGGFDDMLKTIDALPLTEVGDPDRPSASYLSFGLQALALSNVYFPKATTDQRRAAANVIGKVFSTKALAPIDAKTDKNKKDEISFQIPAEVTSITDMLLYLTVVPDFAFDRGSWPWTVARQLAFAYGGQNRYFKEEITRLYTTDDIGPIGSLALAETFGLLNTEASALFARRGLKLLTIEACQRDVAALLGANNAAGQCLRNVLGEFRKLTKEELETLAAILPDDNAKLLRKFWKAIQPVDGGANEQSLDAATRALWPQLKTLLERRLHELAKVGA